MVASPLVVLAGPTASGKSHLALRLAEAFAGEIVSCDSVAVYREMEIGAAKPPAPTAPSSPTIFSTSPHPASPSPPETTAAKPAQRSRTSPPAAACPSSRAAPACTSAPSSTASSPPRPSNPLSASASAPAPQPTCIASSRASTPPPPSASTPTTSPSSSAPSRSPLAARRPITEQWQAGREPLTGYRILRLGLDPPRPALYARIDRRAAAMFSSTKAGGLIEETRALLARHGPQRAFTSLGYAQATAFLRDEISLEEAIRLAQQGHRNYAKRQLTWFRKEPNLHWLHGFGDDPAILLQAAREIATFFQHPAETN